MVSLPDRNLSRAVLIGTSEFAQLPNLPAVHNNLSDLRAALTHPRHGILAPANCEVVANPASPAVFMNRLQQVVNRTDDFLFVYYAGHGIRHDTKDELYLTVPGTDIDALYGTAVEFKWVRDVLEHSPARACLLVLDCCYSGMALGTMSAPDTRDIEVRGSAVLASSPKNRKSHSPVGHRHTAFTGKVIDLLRNGSPVAGEPLTVSTLYKRVSVALVNEQFPKPTLRTIDTSGDLLVRRFEKSIPVAPARPQVTEPSRPAPAIPQGYPPISAGQWAKVVPVVLLWTVVGISLAIAVGGLFGLFFGVPRQGGSTGDDASYLAAGTVMTAVFGIPLLVLRRQWRGDLPVFDPPILTRAAGGRAVLIAGVILFLALALTYLFGSPAGNSGGSAVMSRTSLAFVMAELAGWCGLLLFRWRTANAKSRR